MLFTSDLQDSLTIPAFNGVARRNPNTKEPPLAVSASRRQRPLEIDRDETGEITQVRIGPWRKVASRSTRKISEVRPLLSGHVALMIQNTAGQVSASASSVWQLYSPSGHLLAMMQPNDEGQEWMTTHFRSPETNQTLTESQLFVSA